MSYTIMLVVFPLIYYITSPEFYYRRPLDPIMVVLAVYALIPSRRLDKLPTVEDRLRVSDYDALEPEMAEQV
jgi:hypothetical protein